jgi:uncharacterized membrane protein
MDQPETQDTINQREWENPMNWRGGVYSSRADTRLWVPKGPGHGAGQTLNFAQPGAWAAIAAMCVVPAALLLMFVLLRLFG